MVTMTNSQQMRAEVQQERQFQILSPSSKSFVMAMMLGAISSMAVVQPSAAFSLSPSHPQPSSESLMSTKMIQNNNNRYGPGFGIGGMYSTTTAISSSKSSTNEDAALEAAAKSTRTITTAFKTIPLPMAGYGLNVPVSCWFPIDNDIVDSETAKTTAENVQYEYQINVRKIGQLLAGWDFIPSFASRSFTFPTTLVDGQNIDIPVGKDVVVLAHGYLGSPLDLSMFAEKLAEQGYVCVAAQYPESLEASYPRMDGLERRTINNRLIQYLTDELRPTSFSALGHSMGAGTVLQIGDDTWNRVLLGIGKVPPINGEINGRFGRFADPGGKLLLITSTNDGAVQFGGGISVPNGYTLLDENALREQADTISTTKIPDRAALVFDRPDAPNHISFLAESTNEAMIEFLSPLLPVAKTFDIPVLDFDKYVTSRDSSQTSEILLPLISNFLVSSKTR